MLDPARVRPLTITDLADILELQATVTAELPLGFIRRKTEPELSLYLNGTLGVAYGIFERATLVAMSLLRVPDQKHPNGGLHFALESAGVVVPAGLSQKMTEQDWSLYTCFLENTMVLAAARGRGYQRALLDARIAHAASAGMRWICAGAHLRNSVSWANLLAKGMAIAGIRFDAGYPVIGLLRSFNALTLESDSNDQIVASAHDPSQHQCALQQEYIGVRLGSDGSVIYQRFLHGGRRAAA